MSAGSLWKDDWTPQYDIGFDLQYTIPRDNDSEWAGLLLYFGVDYLKSGDESSSLADLVSNLRIKHYKGEFPDPRADWHRNYTSPKRWVRAHVYRLAMGWKETRLAEEFEANRNSHLTLASGLTTTSDRTRRSSPSCGASTTRPSRTRCARSVRGRRGDRH